MKSQNSKVTLGARLVLGLLFTVFGLNGFFGFIPMPPFPPEAGQFLGAIVATKYLFPFIKATEIVTGLMLLAGVQVPLALLALAPISLNILAFHFFLTGPTSIGMGVFIIALMIVVARGYWDRFSGLFAKQA